MTALQKLSEVSRVSPELPVEVTSRPTPEMMSTTVAEALSLLVVSSSSVSSVSSVFSLRPNHPISLFEIPFLLLVLDLDLDSVDEIFEHFEDGLLGFLSELALLSKGVLDISGLVVQLLEDGVVSLFSLVSLHADGI